MSRTDAHTPLWVRKRRREERANFTPCHSHEDGVCDLDAVLADERYQWTRWSCTLIYTGAKNICSCYSCSYRMYRVRAIRAERTQWRRVRARLVRDTTAESYVRPAELRW